MAEQNGTTRADIINKLNLSVHGDLASYQGVIGEACKKDPEFLAHLIAFDFTNGQIKDTKIALPVITLASKDFPDGLVENSLAHIAMQDPRSIARALRFSIDIGAPARRQRMLEKTIRQYLVYKEQVPGKWMRLAARHRRSLKTLYSKTHAPNVPEWVSGALFGFRHSAEAHEEHKELRRKYVNLMKLEGGSLSTWALFQRMVMLKTPMAYPPGSIFADIAGLSKMSPAQAAATIQKWHLSPLIVGGAMAGAKATQADAAVVQAGLEQMSDTEVVTRAKSLQKHGLAHNEALKDTFRKKVSRATTSKKATLKTSVAAEEMEDEGLKTMLQELQERQIQAQKDAGRGIDGNWLVIVDQSSSQEVSIELGTHVGAAITKFVTGGVHLVFCNDNPSPIDVTGLSLDEIRAKCQYMRASGPTSYGVGLLWAASKKLEIDGIVIVGDGGENTPPIFANVLIAYKQSTGKDIPVYFYRTFCAPNYANAPGGNPRNFANLMQSVGLQFTEFDLSSGKIDYYSLPNLVQSMNVNRFGVAEKIMACPLVTLAQVFPSLVAAETR